MRLLSKSVRSVRDSQIHPAQSPQLQQGKQFHHSRRWQTTGLRQRQRRPSGAPRGHVQGSEHLGPHLQQKGPSSSAPSPAQEQEQSGESLLSTEQFEIRWRRWGPARKKAPRLGHVL
ncbi:hypothetical protein NPIL_394921 [Nephila pilipes]|uniref:Uncharacterized protein n=1 Tax=Nephila pilipes TaxID=299642 RepID=A0A8X6TFL7_NEPPI|nr:hypothetical protein NPIL_394921 [Nephila pilipes]